MKSVITSQFFGLSVMLFIAQLATAQNVVFTANASSPKIGVRDQVQFTYTIHTQNPENLTLNPGNLKDFQLVGGPFQTNSTSIEMNGNTTVRSTTIELTYVLVPKHTGTFTIPPAIASDAAGHSYQSNSVSLQVVPGSLARQEPQRQQNDPFGEDPNANDPFAAMNAMLQRMNAAQRGGMRQQQMQQQPQQAPAPVNMSDVYKDIFIKVNVDKQKVHVGEQITASYKLYARLPMQVGISKLPSLNGFWTSDFDIPKQPKPTEEIIDGKKYQVFLLKKSALFPQQSGTLTLDPAEAEGTARIIQQVKRSNPAAGSLFDDPSFQQAFGGSMNMGDPLFNNDLFGSVAYKDVPVHLKSIPLNITVTQLPTKDQPADFGQAVGNFTVKASMDKSALTTDETAALTFTISGSGNLKLIQAPKLQLPNGLDAYEPVVVDTITGRTNTISGSKICTYSVAPHTPGDYVIPSIPFSYFNAQTGQYVTLNTQPFKLHVTPGKHYKPDATKNNPLLTDIHNNIAQPPAMLATATQPLFFSTGYWSCYAMPLLAFLGIIVWKRRDDELSADVVMMKNRKANKIALKRLTTARTLLAQEQRKPFYEEISKAIWLYISDKANIPLSALSKESTAALLMAKNVPSVLQQKIDEVIQDCEMALYAPSGSKQQMQHTYDDAVTIISELEGHLQR